MVMALDNALFNYILLVSNDKITGSKFSSNNVEAL